MNSKSDIVAAIDDFNSGKFGSIPPGALRPTR